MEQFFTGDAQGACDFSFSASKCSPFFHKVSVIAAILRASVRRAIVGLGQLPQHAHAVLTVVHRLEIMETQPVGQLAGIDTITFISVFEQRIPPQRSRYV